MIASQAGRAPAVQDVVVDMVDVVLSGDLDVTSVPLLSRCLQRILDRSPRGLVFDLARVRFLDCAAARTIVGTWRMLPDGQRPVLRHPSLAVRRLLSVTGLDERCVIEPGVPGRQLEAGRSPAVPS